MASSPNSPAAVNGLASKLFVLVNYSFCAFSFSFAFAFDPGDAGSHIEFPLTALSLSFNVYSLFIFSHYLERLVMIMTYKFRQLYFTRINDECA